MSNALKVLLPVTFINVQSKYTASDQTGALVLQKHTSWLNAISKARQITDKPFKDRQINL